MAKFVPLLPEEDGNEISWYTAGAAGIASGILKVPEGIFSLAAELIDLGLDTNTAAGVEQFFDTLNPFEEVAERHGAGKLVEALVSIGVQLPLDLKLEVDWQRKHYKQDKQERLLVSEVRTLLNRLLKRTDSTRKQVK